MGLIKVGKMTTLHYCKDTDLVADLTELLIVGDIFILGFLVEHLSLANADSAFTLLATNIMLFSNFVNT